VPVPQNSHLFPQEAGRKNAGVNLMTRATNPIFLAIVMAQIAALPINPQVLFPHPLVRDLAVLDLNGHTVRYSRLKGRVTVVAFISTRCPMSNAFNSRLNALYNDFGSRVRFIAVNSNTNEPLEEVRHHAQNMGYDFPVYKDVNNAMADFFGARATPDTFVVDQKGIVKYHGYIEDAPNPERAKNHALRLAIEAVLRDKPVLMPETHSLGCAIRRAQPKDN
jgi:hypothetical protein